MTPDEEVGASHSTPTAPLPSLADEAAPDEVVDDHGSEQAEAEPAEAEAAPEAEAPEEASGPKAFGESENPRDRIARLLREQRQQEEGEDIEFTGDFADPTNRHGNYVPRQTDEGGEVEAEAEVESEEPVTQAEAQTDEPMRTIKVNGQNIEVPQSEFEAAAMKYYATGDYLSQAREEANRLRQLRKQFEQNPPQAAPQAQPEPEPEVEEPKVAEIDSDLKKKIYEGVQFGGEPDEFFDAFREGVERIVAQQQPQAQSPEPIDPEAVRNMAREEVVTLQDRNRAASEWQNFQADNPEITSNASKPVQDAFVGQWVREMQTDILNAGYDQAEVAQLLGTDMNRTYLVHTRLRQQPEYRERIRTEGQTLEAAKTVVVPLLDGNQEKPSDNPPQTPDRRERARGASPQPRRAGQPPAAPPPAQRTEEQSRKDAIAQMRKARGLH